jgi:hypothetical protein
MADCGCLYIGWTKKLDSKVSADYSDGGEFLPVGIYDGCSYYEINIVGIGIFYLFFDAVTQDWYLGPTLGDTNNVVATYDIDPDLEDCPIGEHGYWVTVDAFNFPYNMVVLPCGSRQTECCFSVNLVYETETGSEGYQFNSDLTTAQGVYNGYLWWQYCIGGEGYTLVGEPVGDVGCLWTLYRGKCGWSAAQAVAQGDQVWTLLLNDGHGCCPISEIWSINESSPVSYFSTGPCVDPPCVPIEDRHQRKYDSIKLPEIFEEQDRGFKICCDCPMLVLAGGGSETWKNDVTSAWIKVSDPADTFSFILEKDGQPVTSYTPTVEEFPNEDNAYYTTIQWKDVLPLEGIGCYTLKVAYDISGVTGDFIWGQYNLQPYTIQNALETARVRVKFNLNQEIEGINFTGANVEDCIRFNGFIGDRQVNTEIDNLIYQDRTVKTVVRENLDQYIISTDPLLPCFISALTDLYLLSENEMWISDYNAHNHLYNILDIPVVVEEAPEIDYLDRWQRRAVLTCTVGLRTKNRRTYYRGN